MKETRVIALCSTKGGVGKTTLAANIAAFLVRSGRRVLLIDADTQPSLSRYFPLSQTPAGGLNELLRGSSWEGVINQTTLPNLDVVCSNDPEGTLQFFVRDKAGGRSRLCSEGGFSEAGRDKAGGRSRLRRLLDSLQGYDDVVIDTQGAVGALQDAVMLAATILISPLPPDVLTVREFITGLPAVLTRLERFAAELGTQIPSVHGVFYRMERTRDAKDVAGVLRDAVASGALLGVRLLDSVIHSSVVWKKSASRFGKFKKAVRQQQSWKRC